jgi:ClpP class serine protease
MWLDGFGDWAIVPEVLRGLQSRAATLDIRTLQAYDSQPADQSEFITTRGDVSILHLKGALTRYHGWFSQGPSYGELRKAYQSMIDSGTRAALLIVDSPGGEINGLFELCEALYEGRSKFQATAVYAAGACASAAYWLSSAFSDRLYCSATSNVGSIGVIATLVDESKALADMGIREYEIISSASPKKSQQPGDSAYRARVQQRLNDTADVLIRAVARYRGTTMAKVLSDFGQGDVLVGQRAVDVGLADALSSAEAVIASLQSKVATKSIFPMPSMLGGSAALTQKGAPVMNAKLEKHRAALGMSSSASPEDVKAAWKALKASKEGAKQADRDQEARALGLPPGMSKAEISAAVDSAAATLNMSPARIRELAGVTRADQLPKKKA